MPETAYVPLAGPQAASLQSLRPPAFRYKLQAIAIIVELDWHSLMNISVDSERSGTLTIEIDFPDICPVCSNNIFPRFRSAITRIIDNREELQCVFRCASEKCKHLFLSIYKPELGRGYIFRKSYPIVPRKSAFEQTIAETSPQFIEIYDQAISAESFGLYQVVGIALRKALEFLVKDYSIRTHPDNEDKIRGFPLKRVIDDYLEDTNLKNVAKRAAWLGNDETHYERIWSDKDVEDLKRLIHLVVNYVDNDIVTRTYIEGMPDDK